MRHAAFAQKTAHSNTHSSNQVPAAGPQARALDPPAYGLETLDHAAREATPAHDQASPRAAAIQLGAAGDEASAQPANRTGLPDRLKAGVERLSGLALDDVRVHFNSARPAQLQALAYTQGAAIHVGPGQERHLPHEAWHVVQQKQGRVKATMQLKGVGINADRGLEREADVMGGRATQIKPPVQFRCTACIEEEKRKSQGGASIGAPVQMQVCQGTNHDTSNAHRAIEVDYTNNINSHSSREYEIPGGSLDTNPNGEHKIGYADIADQNARELYEIKRHNEPYPQAQLDHYLQAANIACHGNWVAGNYYPSERIIDFSAYEINKEIVARKDARPGFIRYEKRDQGGPLGISAMLGGGMYVRGGANAANLPAIDEWVTIWTRHIWDSAKAPEAIDERSAPYTKAVQEINQIVDNTKTRLRGGELDHDILRNGWEKLQSLIQELSF